MLYGHCRLTVSAARQGGGKSENFLSVLPVCVENRWIMFFCTGPPDWGKPHFPILLPMSWGVGFKVTSGPVLDKRAMLAGILTSLEPNDVLFIDEIHRLSPGQWKSIYTGAMEDYRIDISYR